MEGMTDIESAFIQAAWLNWKEYDEARTISLWECQTCYSLVQHDSLKNHLAAHTASRST